MNGVRRRKGVSLVSLQTTEFPNKTNNSPLHRITLHKADTFKDQIDLFKNVFKIILDNINMFYTGIMKRHNAFVYKKI